MVYTHQVKNIIFFKHNLNNHVYAVDTQSVFAF